MHTQYLIIGQGIAGTLVSHELWRAGKDFMVMDDGNMHNASYTAAAVINPLGGRSHNPLPDADIIITKAVETYHMLEELLDGSFFTPRELYYFPADTIQQLHFARQQSLYPQYFYPASDIPMSEPYFNAPYPPGVIKGLWQVDALRLLSQWRLFLERHRRLITTTYDSSLAQIDKDGVRYKDIAAEKIIFCDGAAGAGNPWLNHMPFTANRGDALLLEIPGLPRTSLYEYGLRLVPYHNNLFWCGSNYQWSYTDLQPDKAWEKQVLQILGSWLKVPVTVQDHKVGIRPTTAGQKVFAGLHPEMPSVAYLNGLGTRGFSVGPLYAARLAAML